MTRIAATLLASTALVLLPPCANAAADGVYAGRAGGSDNAAVLAGLAPGRYVLGGGVYRVAADATVRNGVVLDVRPGSSIAVDAGKVLTIRGTVEPGVHAKIFTGAGTVTGLRFNRPVWWGIGADSPGGVGTDERAVNAAVASLESSYGSDGDTQKVALGCQPLTIAAPIAMTPTNLANDELEGCGEQSGGTSVSLSSRFSGAGALVLNGSAPNSAAASSSWRVRNIQFVAPAALAQTCVVFGPGGTRPLGGDKSNPIEDVSCQNFKRGFTGANFRLVHGARLSFFSSVPGAACFHLVPGGTAAFIGDSDFDINCSPNQGASNSSVTAGDTTATSYGYLGTPNGGGINGLRFSGAYYHSNAGFRLQSINGGGLGDIWFQPGTQFDGNQCNVIDATVDAPSGGTPGTGMQDIQVRGTYMRGIVTGCVAMRFVNNVGAAATFDGLMIEDNWVANANGTIVRMTGVNSGVVSGNLFGPTGYRNSAAIVLQKSVGVTIAANQCMGPGNGTYQYSAFVSILAGSDYISVTGNNSNGLCGRPVSDGSGGRHVVNAGNQ